MQQTLHPTTKATPSYKGQYLKTIKRRTKSAVRFEFWFKIDPDQRPDLWEQRYPNAIRLPRDRAERTGLDPNIDPTEYAAAFQEAAELFAELNRLRRTPEGGADWPYGSLRWLVNAWRKSNWFRDDLADNTRRLYEQCLKIIEDWADRTAERNRGIHPHVRQMTPKGIAALLHQYDDRPTRRGHIRRALKNLFAYACEKGLRDTNPVDEVVMRRTKVAKKKTVLWTQAFVDVCVEWAYENEHPEAAAMMLLMWDCGRRPNDIFRLELATDTDMDMLASGALNADARPILYDAHRRAIMGWVAKTGNYIEIPLDEPTIAAIARVCPDPDSNRRHIFVHSRSGEPYTTDTWKWIWRAMRKYAAAQDGMAVFAGTTWQKGRASSIVRNARAGLDDALITALSDHSDPRTVYRHYWVPNDTQAKQAKEARRAHEGRETGTLLSDRPAHIREKSNASA